MATNRQVGGLQYVADFSQSRTAQEFVRRLGHFRVGCFGPLKESLVRSVLHLGTDFCERHDASDSKLANVPTSTDVLKLQLLLSLSSLIAAIQMQGIEIKRGACWRPVVGRI